MAKSITNLTQVEVPLRIGPAKGSMRGKRECSGCSWVEVEGRQEQKVQVVLKRYSNRRGAAEGRRSRSWQLLSRPMGIGGK
jgi:hypothetical protein